MWFTRIGYYFTYGLWKSKHGVAIRRRSHIWLILGIICISQLGLCQAQKDSGDGAAKGANNALQTSQKGSEVGDSSSRGFSPLAGRTGTVRAVHTQSAVDSGGGGSGANLAPSPSQNVNIPPQPQSRPGSSVSGAGAAGVGTENVGADANANTSSGLQPQQPQQPLSASAAQGQDQDQQSQVPAPSSPQQPRQLHPQFSRPIQSAAGNRPIGGISAGNGDQPPAIGGNINPSNTSASDGTGAGVAAGTVNANNGGKSGGNKSGRKNANSRTGGTSAAAAPGGDTNGGGGFSDIVEATTKSGGGSIGSGDDADSQQQRRGSPGVAPNSPQFGQTGPRNIHVGGDGGLRPLPAGPVQLAPRSGQPQLGQPSEPLDPIATPIPASPQPPATGGQGSDGGTDDTASSALIKAVNDEYVDVVKNLTDAGVLTEADYESKPVSDLFALLLEKLINTNPGASEEEQRHLVHQAGTEFVEVFKANAAVTKNVSEIVRLVNEQLQSAPIVLNEGHSDGASGDLGGPGNEQTASTFNPFDAGNTALRFGSAGRGGSKTPQTSAEFGLAGNGSLLSNQSGGSFQSSNQPAGPNVFGTNRRPLNGQSNIPGGEVRLPGPPGTEEESDNEQGGSSSPPQGNETSTTKNGFVLLPSGAGNVPGSDIGPTTSPAPAFGFNNVPSLPKFGGANGQTPFTQDNNATNPSENGTSLLGSAVEPVVTTQEPQQQSPPVAPVGNPRFPFPAHAPSTLRPPLRFYTITTTVASAGSEIDSGAGAGGGLVPANTQPPPLLGGSSPGFVPVGQSSVPPDGGVIIGGTPPPDTLVGGGDFPTPPTWDFSGSTPGPVIVGGGGVISGADVSGGPKLVTLQPPESGIFGETGNSTNASLQPSLTPFGQGPAFGQGGHTQLPVITTSSEGNPAPFTHDVFGNNARPLVPSDGELNITAINAEGNTTVSNSSGDEWLVFGSGLSNAATPGPFSDNNSTLGEAFITDSLETSGSISTSTSSSASSGLDLNTPPSGILSNLTGANSNETNVFIPGQGAGLEPITTSTHSNLELHSGNPETTISGNYSELELNETTPSSVANVSEVVLIGQETGQAASIPPGIEATTLGTVSVETTIVSLFGPSGGNPNTSSNTDTSTGIVTVTSSHAGLETSTVAEIEPGPDAEEASNVTSDHGVTGGDIVLPTHAPAVNTTSGPGVIELETTTAAGTSVASSNAVIVWSFRIPDMSWDPELLNKESTMYQDLYNSLILDLQTLFKTLEPKHFADVTIKRFSQGSVVVSGETEFTERVDSAQLVEKFVKLVAERKDMIGGRTVDPSSITFDRRYNAPQYGSSSNTSSSGRTPNWVIALVVAVVLLALIVVAAVVVIKRRKRQANRDNYMVDEETMNGGPKPWAAQNHRAGQQAPVQQHSGRGTGLSNGRDQYAGVNMYEMKEPSAPNAHLNYGYQPDRAANGHGAPHGRSVTEIHINAETNVDNEASSKH